VLAVVSLGVPLALSLSERVNAEVHSQALSEADVLAATSADLLHPVNTLQLEALTRAGASAVRGRVLIVDASGAVLADSVGRSTLGQSYRSRPEIAVALRGSPVQAQRASVSLGQNILATAVPVLRRGQAVGAVRITQSVAAVRRAVRGTIVKLILVAATVLLLGLLAGALIARQTALPLARLEGTARRLADGALSARASVEGSSEQRSLSRSFNEMADRLGRLIAAQREFVADASHQLRTPLTGLRLRLEEARAAGTDNAVAAHLDAGVAEVDRLAEIVAELLLLSRAEDRELEGEHVDLLETASRAATRWRAAAQAGGATILVLAERSGTAWCPPGDLDRALDVLIENAIRYASGGGEIALACGPEWIEVRDRGPGLDEGEATLLFERFHRGGAGRRGPAGSGLGLAIARTLARAWGGEARIADRPGGGAVARLEFAERGQ
jgi:two-component system, OmpR family, sensor kinase